MCPLFLAYIHHLSLGNVDAALLCARLIAANH
jgi:hypothetical protein